MTRPPGTGDRRFGFHRRTGRSIPHAFRWTVELWLQVFENRTECFGMVRDSQGNGRQRCRNEPPRTPLRELRACRYTAHTDSGGAGLPTCLGMHLGMNELRRSRDVLELDEASDALTGC